MVTLSDRLTLPDDQRYEWLQVNDTYLISELDRLFTNFVVRGAKVDKFKNPGKLALEYFEKFPEVDYFIYSSCAPTLNDMKYVEKSRILFYRISQSWSRGRSGRSHFRPAACRFVRLKKQILTIFDEELHCAP